MFESAAVCKRLSPSGQQVIHTPRALCRAPENSSEALREARGSEARDLRYQSAFGPHNPQASAPRRWLK